MPGRIIEVASDSRHLSVSRGFMLISVDREEVGRVPLDDIDVLLASGHGISFSANLVTALAERGAAFVICAPNRRPSAWIWPVEGHHAQAGRLRAQLDAPLPLSKRMWREVVRAKIDHQAAVLRARGQPADGFGLLARRVRSGDPENVEAQAARRYWPLLMDGDFTRDPDGTDPVNRLLNYGYGVLRATMARQVCAAGLHPSLGIKHRSAHNPYCLVDDLMEPWRPFADIAVARLLDDGIADLEAPAKKRLVSILDFGLRGTDSTTPIVLWMQRLAISVGLGFEQRKSALDLPICPLPLDLAGLGLPPPAEEGDGE